MRKARIGGQLGDTNVIRFLAWAEERRLHNDWHRFVRAGGWFKNEIQRKSGCGRSSLDQNKRIVRRLHRYGLIMQARGIFDRADEVTDGELLQEAEAGALRQDKVIRTLSRKVQQLEAKLAESEARNASLEKKLQDHRIPTENQALIEDLLLEFGTTPH